jgi:hypothetical protein
MKKVLIGLFMLVGFYSNAQEYKLEEKSISCVFDANGKTKAELYLIINKWISLNFVSPKTVLQLNDADTGNIIIKSSDKIMYKCLYLSFLPKIYIEKGSFEYILGTYGNLIEIDVKDNKYRVKYTINQCIKDFNNDINTTELYKGINFINDNYDNVDYNILADSYCKYFNIKKKDRENFILTLKPTFKEINTVLEKVIKTSLLSIDELVKSTKNDKW